MMISTMWWVELLHKSLLHVSSDPPMVLPGPLKLAMTLGHADPCSQC